MNARIQAIRERIAAATPGPWHTSLCNTGEKGEKCWCRCVGNKVGSDRLEDCIIPSGSVNVTNAELIAAAPADLAFLAAALEVAMGALEKCEEEIGRSNTWEELMFEIRNECEEARERIEKLSGEV